MRYIPRLLDSALSEVLATFPAALLLGPRACGKTTSARCAASNVVELDDPRQAAPFRADPSAALRAQLRRRGHTPGPVLLDEWQEVPEVLGAVKRAVDKGAGPGSFLLTGSIRAAPTSASWPVTGRVIELDMHPMTVLELQASGRPRTDLIARLFDGATDDLVLPAHVPDLIGYVDLAIVGGYPPAVRLDQSERRIWLESYAEQLILRDIPKLGDIRDPLVLRRLLRAIAEHTAGLVSDTELAISADMSVKATRRQERMLENLRIVEALTPWHSNRISRLIKARKRFLVDPGLATALLGVEADAVMSDGSLLGRILETFVMAQLRPLLGLNELGVRTYHLRQQDGRREVDVVLEAADGRIVGVEIKATSSPSVADARHLAWMRDQLGAQFVAGVVLSTASSIYSLGDRLSAVPIAALWGQTG